MVPPRGCRNKGRSGPPGAQGRGGAVSSGQVQGQDGNSSQSVGGHRHGLRPSHFGRQNRDQHGAARGGNAHAGLNPSANSSRRSGRGGRGRRSSVAEREDVAPSDKATSLGTPDHLSTFSVDIYHRVPRRNINYPGSDRSNLPDVSIHGSQRGGTPDPDDLPGPDVRNEIAPKHTIDSYVDEYGIEHWNLACWDYCAREVWEMEKPHNKRLYLHGFVNSWMENVPDLPVVSLGQDAPRDHYMCAIDPQTGTFLPPIEHPVTISRHHELDQKDTELCWRHLYMTSELVIYREMKLRKRREIRTQGRQANNYYKGRRGFDAKPITGVNLPRDYDPDNETHVSLPFRPVEQKADEQQVVEPEPEKVEYKTYQPKVPCFLRPAKLGDMQAICDIYNWEVEHGIQAFDTQPVSVKVFENIFSTSRENELPFIVAVHGSARDNRYRKGNVDLSTWPQPASTPESKKLDGKVLGFAYLSVLEPGLGGSMSGSGCAATRAYVFVHPDFRRKKIGFSLVDRLLICVSLTHIPQKAHDFIDLQNSRCYRGACQQHGLPRQIYKIQLHYHVRHKHITVGDEELEKKQASYDDELVSIRKVLDEKLFFDEAFRFEAVHCLPGRGEGGKTMWVDSVVFEHPCVRDPRILNKDN